MNPICQSHCAAMSEKFRAGTRQGIVARALICISALLGFWPSQAFASPALVIEMPSGAILYEDHATQPWYPASLTKLMTVYVALSAVRDQRIALETPLSVSARAAMMPPSKMGFRPGSLVTLDNALKMLMVKSANDMAVVIAEGVSGSVEAFAEDMNSTAREPRPHSVALRQSERPAGPRACLFRARPRDPRARALSDLSRAGESLQHRRLAARRPNHPEPQ